MVVLKNQNRRSGIFYLRPLCGFGFFSKSDFSAIFFSHFRSSTDSFLKFSLSRLQINAKYACSVSLSWLTISPAVSSISFSGLSSCYSSHYPSHISEKFCKLKEGTVYSNLSDVASDCFILYLLLS